MTDSLENKWDSTALCPETSAHTLEMRANMTAIVSCEGTVYMAKRESRANRDLLVTRQGSSPETDHSRQKQLKAKSQPRVESFPFPNRETKWCHKQEWRPDSMASFEATFLTLTVNLRHRRIYRRLKRSKH